MIANSVHKLGHGVTLVLGGARSGKSDFAERLVNNSGLRPVYLATARAEDEEMRQRIEIHRERRNRSAGLTWKTIEEPLALAEALRNYAHAGDAVLVDCLTLWLTNLMVAGTNVERETASLVQCLNGLGAPVVFVSNEVGLGIVPENAMAREFRDLAGSLHRQIAARADDVYFIAAGLPIVMKSAN